ncbi:unnamed protein product [Aphanomyces euteiches]|uniref:Uncharacterized protein n=1 Tax=Aphanomyces euteiches TaxID=100861 RepID=A0A6G0XGQ3_9STRA|nr:hypothetical protein Ae201684_005164 [Aphanomyces euteiches]KAH9080755.1 hypothetical protein Ae201684P_012895 [Aphanomyces euteiches]
MAAIADVQPIHYHVTLVSRGDARLHAKQWLVEQLYYNTERVFHTFPDVDAADNFVNCSAKCAGPWLHMVEMCQASWPNSLDEIKRLFLDPASQKIICIDEKLEMERDGNTRLAHSPADEQFPWYILQGHFYDADRFVAVFRHLNDDEASDNPASHPDYYEMKWVVVHRISESKCVVRMLGYRTMLLDGMIAFAKNFGNNRLDQTGVDVKTVEREVAAFGNGFVWEYQKRMQALIGQLEMLSME